MRRRVLFVGRGRLTLPLQPWLRKKWDALSEFFDLRVVNAGSGEGDARFRMLPDAAPSFYSRLPRVVADRVHTRGPRGLQFMTMVEIGSHHPTAVVGHLTSALGGDGVRGGGRSTGA